MRRTNGVSVAVAGPTVGLVTRIPSNLPDKKAGRALTVASNVRAERGVLSAAPGYEKVAPKNTNLDSPANLIFEANITNVSQDIQNTPIIGTGGKVFAVYRRAQELVCGVNTCQLTAALVGDTFGYNLNQSSVAAMIAGWDPDIFVHLGNMIDSGTTRAYPDLMIYEEAVGQYYYTFLGGYVGYFGTGPVDNRFFPAVGHHEWHDAPIAEYYDFFTLPGNKRYYSFRRGPCEFFVFSSDVSEPDGVSSGSVQGTWLAAAIAASDCPWRFVVCNDPLWCSDATLYPGRSDLQWIASVPGVSAVISGHAHNMEIIEPPGLPPQIICGTGGVAFSGFNATMSTYSAWSLANVLGALQLSANSAQATFSFYSASPVNLLHALTLTTPNPSSGVCYVLDAAFEPVSLAVTPASATVEIGSSYQFTAWATLRNGDVADVTTKCVWTSSNDGVGKTGSRPGYATGRAKGSAFVYASYSTLSSSGTLNVLQTCVDAPLDIMVIVSRSRSMGAQAGPDNRLEAVKEGLILLSDSLTDQDRIGLVSCGGDVPTQTQEAKLDCPLDAQISDFKGSVSLLVHGGGASIPLGLQLAQSELDNKARSTARKVVVVITDWPADVSLGGDPTTEWTAIASGMQAMNSAVESLLADSATVVVIGYDIPGAYVSALQESASDGYYFSCASPDEVRQAIEGLPYNFCFYGKEYYYYQPGGTACALNVMNVTQLKNWTVS